MAFFSRRQKPTDRRILWGGVAFSDDELEPHFMVMGTPGSGKTLTIRMLMKSALFDASGPLVKRALVYDPKLDFYPILRGFGVPATQIRVLHPLDQRCDAWDVAADIADPISARQFAATLCPAEDRDANRFFSEAAQDILTAVINCLRKSTAARASKWLFGDLIEATSSPARLKQVLRLEPEGTDAMQMHLQHSGRTAAAILCTLRAHLAKYENVGVLWSKRRLFSLGADWLDASEPKVLLVPTDEKHREVLDPINRAFIRRASELVLARPDKPETKQKSKEEDAREVWFFLDELRLARKLPGLEDLLLKGRSKAVRCVLGFQSIEGLHHVYGDKAADELLGQCGNKAILRLDSPQAMNWASRYFADVEYLKKTSTTGWSQSPQGWTNSGSVSRSLGQRAVMLPIEFREFPTANEKVGITGVFNVPSFRPWRGTIDARFVDAHKGSRSKLPNDAGFLARDAKDQERRPWEQADYDRLGVQPPQSEMGDTPTNHGPPELGTVGSYQDGDDDDDDDDAPKRGIDHVSG